MGMKIGSRKGNLDDYIYTSFSGVKDLGYGFSLVGAYKTFNYSGRKPHI